MTIKKLSYVLLLTFLNSPINLIASGRISQKIAPIIVRPKLWRTAIHEAGHTIQAIQHPTQLKNFAYATIQPARESSGHICATNNSYLSQLQGEDLKNSMLIDLAGAAAEHVHNNKKAFTSVEETLTYLKDPRYAGDMQNLQEMLNIIQASSPHLPINKNDTIASLYKEAYQFQLAQKNNTFKIAAELIDKQTLSANDIYKKLNTYTYTGTHPHSYLTTQSNNKSIEERFHPSGEKYSQARFKDNNLVNVKYYDENGLPKPKYIVDKQKQALLLKMYTTHKITSKEHHLNGQPKIGPAISKNYKYGYDNNLQYVGYKGSFSVYGRDRKKQMAELD